MPYPSGNGPRRVPLTRQPRLPAGDDVNVAAGPMKFPQLLRDGSLRAFPLHLGRRDALCDLVGCQRAGLGQRLAVGELQHAGRQIVVRRVAAARQRLPDERRSITHKFSVADQEGYITVGLYPDGQPGEIFMKMAKEGSTVSGLMDTLATTISVSLQYGVPLRDLVNKFAHVRFEPSGFTGNQEIPIAKSLVDYIFRWLGSRFLSPEEKVSLGLQPAAETGDETEAHEREQGRDEEHGDVGGPRNGLLRVLGLLDRKSVV